MDGLIIALIAFCIVLLVVSLTYVLTNIRHKERMMLLEKDKSPDFFKTPDAHQAPLKWGMLFIGIGLGFFTAFLVDHYFFSDLTDTEALYPAMVFLFGGLGLAVFHYRLARN